MVPNNCQNIADFRELREKIQIQEKVDQGIIRYKERITYFFDQERSGSLTEEDELTILNVPYVVRLSRIKIMHAM